MKKKLICFLLICVLLCALQLPSYAESYSSENWYVTFTANEKMDSNFDSDTIASLLGELQPGDQISIRIDLKNAHSKAVDWYMRNEVLQSLEAGAANGGGYTYELTYTGSGGQDVLFSSARVGGETEPSASVEGLKEATTNLKDYFYLDTIASGGSGSVTLTVGLDGETQGNDYQTKIANLIMRFAVEIPTTGTVRTGDDSNYLPLWIGMIVGGLVLLYVVLDGITDRIYFGKRRAEK